MKPFLTAGLCGLLLATLIFSCRKNSNNNLSLLQHTWRIISLNGEVYRYVGHPDDYYNFATDNKLYTFTGGTYDTSLYALTNGGQTLTLTAITNGKPANGSLSLNIYRLTADSLILHGCATVPVVCILDSLKR